MTTRPRSVRSSPTSTSSTRPCSSSSGPFPAGSAASSCWRSQKRASVAGLKAGSTRSSSWSIGVRFSLSSCFTPSPPLALKPSWPLQSARARACPLAREKLTLFPTPSLVRAERTTETLAAASQLAYLAPTVLLSLPTLPLPPICAGRLIEAAGDGLLQPPPPPFIVLEPTSGGDRVRPLNSSSSSSRPSHPTDSLALAPELGGGGGGYPTVSLTELEPLRALLLSRDGRRRLASEAGEGFGRCCLAMAAPAAAAEGEAGGPNDDDDDDGEEVAVVVADDDDDLHSSSSLAPSLYAYVTSPVPPSSVSSSSTSTGGLARARPAGRGASSGHESDARQRPRQEGSSCRPAGGRPFAPFACASAAAAAAAASTKEATTGSSSSCCCCRCCQPFDPLLLSTTGRALLAHLKSSTGFARSPSSSSSSDHRTSPSGPGGAADTLVVLGAAAAAAAAAGLVVWSWLALWRGGTGSGSSSSWSAILSRWAAVVG